MSEALTAQTISITGFGGDEIEAYLAIPDDGAPSRGSVVVIHHMPGYDSSSKEIVRKFAANGYAALMPNLYHREAPGASPDDAAATARANGGVPDGGSSATSAERRTTCAPCRTPTAKSVSSATAPEGASRSWRPAACRSTPRWTATAPAS